MKLFNKKMNETEQLSPYQEALQVYYNGVTTLRDIIAPEAMEISFNYIQMGSYFIRSFFVLAYPRYLQTDWLSPVINFDFTMDVSMHIYPLSTEDMMKKLKIEVGQIESRINIDENNSKPRDPMLLTAWEDVETLRDLLQKGETKLFHFGLYFTIYAKTKDELEENTKKLESALNSQLVLTKQANLQQEAGLNSCLPFAQDQLIITQNLDTMALSTTFPFVSSTLTSDSGILYGANMNNNSLIIFDRFELENANTLVLAKSGAGKSFAVKLELLRSLYLDTEVIVIDPENEYKSFCDTVGGSHFNISISSEQRINPFDLPIISEGEESRDVLKSNIIALHGLLRIMLGKISATEDDIIDKALIETYASKGITSDPGTHHLKPPTMQDLQKVLVSVNGGNELAIKLRKFTAGSYSGLLNNHTNIDLNNKFMVFSTRDLEDEIRPIAMYMILNFIWGKVKSYKRKRILVVDEAWYLLKYDDSANFLFSIAKRARKYYLGLTTITQDVEDFLKSPYGKPIVTNSSLALLLKQHPAAVDAVVSTFKLTNAEKYHLLNCGVGQGLFFAGTNHVAIDILASTDEEALLTTKPKESNKK
jgi:conjugal transfer ATP-binding protein TraC